MSRPTLRRSGAAALALLLGVTLTGPAAASASDPSASGPADAVPAPVPADAERPLAAPWHPLVQRQLQVQPGVDLAADQDRPVTAAAVDGVRDLAAACPAGRVPAGGFRDTAGSVFAPAIDCLVWYGITTGRTATTYEPSAPVNRRQMAVFLHRTLESTYGVPEYGGFSRFTDVPDEGFGSAEINVLASADLAEELGRRVVTGKTPTTFDPTGPVTRAQMASFVARTLEGITDVYGIELDADGCRGCFPDRASIPEVHRSSVDLLASLGVVEGRADGRFDPTATVTRGQMAGFLTRALDVLVEVGAAVPPDFVVPLSVDRTACRTSGADGSEAAPFCTIQAGVDAARAYPDRYVVVAVGGDPEVAYTEDVRVDPAATVGLSVSGFDVLIEDPDDGDRDEGDWDDDGDWTLPQRPLRGTVTLATDVERGAVDVSGFDVDGTDTAVVVEGDGYAGLYGVTLRGATSVEVRGEAFVDLLDAELLGADRAVDALDLGWFSAYAVTFGPVSDAYVVLPAGYPAAEELFDELTDGWSDNEFATSTEVATRDGDRAALVPAAPPVR